jgi:hypothetical protein
MKTRLGKATGWITGILLAGTLVMAPLAVSAQTESPQPAATYQPKFKGDPARSDSEAIALGYMRVVIRAQKEYHKKYDKYAATLADLVGGARSFTKRMTQTDRGDYTVSFHSHKEKDSYELALTPKQLDAQHRSFYTDDDGSIRVEEDKAANENSPVLK